jgi:hypothetical protein
MPTGPRLYLPAIALALLLGMTGLAFAVTTELEIESKGEPVPNAEISFETPNGEEITFTEVEETPETGTPPTQETAVADPAPDGEPPQASSTVPENTETPKPTETVTTRVPKQITRISTDDAGTAKVELDEELKDKPVVVVIRRNGEIVSRREVILSGDPVRLTIDVTPEPPAQSRTPVVSTPRKPRLDRTDPPVETVSEPTPKSDPLFSISVRPEVGVIDRGSANLPVRLQFELGNELIVSETFYVDRDDEPVQGLTGDIKLGLPSGSGSFVLGFSRYESESTVTFPTINAGTDLIGILNPQGSGDFIGGPATINSLTYRSEYQEFTLRPGFELAPWTNGSLTLRPRFGGFYGETNEESSTSFSVNGFFTASYTDRLETTRYGGFVGAASELALTPTLSLFANGELRMIQNEASGFAHLTSNLGSCAAGCRQELSDTHFDLGVRLHGGVAANINDNVSASAGVAFETWQVPVRSYAVDDTGLTPTPAGIEWQDRQSVTFSAGMTISFP